MPCQICGAKLLVTQPLTMKTLCPKCHGLLIVDRSLAITISIERLSDIQYRFLRHLKQFKKNRLIVHLVWTFHQLRSTRE